MNAPLARFLTEFAEYKIEERADEPAPDLFEEPAPDLEIEEAEPSVTMTVEAFEQALRDAREQAAAEEQGAVEARLHAVFEEERASMTRGFEAARETWASQEGARLRETLDTSLAHLESALITNVANVLKPLLADAIRARVLAEMRTALAAVLADPSHPAIRIAGPVDLLTAFGQAQSGDTVIDYVVSEDAEMTITTDSTRIESRLSACLEAFMSNEG